MRYSQVVKREQPFFNMQMQNGIHEILESNSIIPVITFHDTSEVESTVQALVEKDIHCIEITLRTEVAFDCIELCKQIAPSNFQVGVGTIMHSSQIQLCRQLDVDFLVSPGSSEKLVSYLFISGIPFLPGVMTPSEIIKMQFNDCRYLKLFPFNIAGGEKALKSYGKVFPEIKFCPTGGINKDNYQQILGYENVMSVGGSWVLG